MKKNKAKSLKCWRTTHNMSKTLIFRVWGAMQQRCYNPNCHIYSYYGARGIKVCKRWLGTSGFANFLKDMGAKPRGMSLDRIDNNRNYKPSNCRWVNHTSQMNNRRSNILITFNGKTQTLTQWAREMGLQQKTLSERIKRSKWSIEKALMTPVQLNQYKEGKRNYERRAKA